MVTSANARLGSATSTNTERTDDLRKNVLVLVHPNLQLLQLATYGQLPCQDGPEELGVLFLQCLVPSIEKLLHLSLDLIAIRASHTQKHDEKQVSKNSHDITFGDAE